MAKRKNEDAAKKGFQIPIEDVNEVEEEAAEDAEEKIDESEAVSEQDEQSASQAEEATDGEDEPVAEGEAEDASSEGSDEEDLIAEAEAIVEEASAAEQLEAAQAQAQDWQDRYMRLHAEWDTYRRRTQEQRTEEKQRATEKLMENLLPVLDDFERTVSYATENGEQGLLEGVKAVQAKLIDVLQALVDAGNTVVVIEHNLDVIKTADYIIDLGPDGGERGGRIVCQGTPEEICKCKESYTAKYLKEELGMRNAEMRSIRRSQ